MKPRSRKSAEERREFRERVSAWARRIKVRPAQIRVQRMSRKWASCSTRGYVSFADALLDQPRLIQDYVIVHELLHLRVPNHGKLFKSLLSAYLPSWQKIEQSTAVRVAGG